ncbi:MAG TPA: hypothetical protein DDW52_22530 [Planctomycetaceae bacterium]|nr:hypothetical protein [Planctomycetaceae bacterium]
MTGSVRMPVVFVCSFHCKEVLGMPRLVTVWFLGILLLDPVSELASVLSRSLSAWSASPTHVSGQTACGVPAFSFSTICIAASGQQADSPAEVVVRKLPSPATKEALLKFLETTKEQPPKSPEDYVAMQQAIRAAAKQLLPMLDKNKEPELFQSVEFDAIASTVALMATYTKKEDQQQVLTRVVEFLKSREELSLPDLNTGMHAAMLLELQPDKEPAKKLYRLLTELTKDDQRPEILGLRITIEGSLRRLELLGKKLPLAATSMAGKKITIDQFAGKYLIVVFFVTNSRSCEAAFPALARYDEKYGDALDVVAIAVENDPAKLKNYIAKLKIQWPVIHDNSADYLKRLHYQYGVTAYPCCLLINKIGEVVSLEAHSAELERLMEMLFEAPKAAPAPPSAAEGEEDGDASTPSSPAASIP